MTRQAQVAVALSHGEFPGGSAGAGIGELRVHVARGDEGEEWDCFKGLLEEMGMNCEKYLHIKKDGTISRIG